MLPFMWVNLDGLSQRLLPDCKFLSCEAPIVLILGVFFKNARRVLSKIKGDHVPRISYVGTRHQNLLVTCLINAWWRICTAINPDIPTQKYITDQPKEYTSKELSDTMCLSLSTPNCVCEAFINFILANENSTKESCNLSDFLKITIDTRTQT